jgi:hypothetical protein
VSVNLRDRLFSDTGGVVQGATVQAVLVTGGGTDAGTSSVVTATTTSDVNGVWKFTALADPGAGNWYDVKIINGNQIRWRYGNIQSAINTLLLNASYTITAGNTWDFTASAGMLKANDPRITGQYYTGTVTQTLPSVTGLLGSWRFFKAFGGTLPINGPTNLMIGPGATIVSSTYTSPNGESTGWYCDGTYWVCV